MNEKQKFGEAIRFLRLRAGKGMPESAAQCGKTKQWLSEIEHGRTYINFKDAKILVNFYGSTLSELVNIIEQ